MNIGVILVERIGIIMDRDIINGSNNGYDNRGQHNNRDNMDALIACNREMTETVSIEWIEDGRRGRDDCFDNKGGKGGSRGKSFLVN